MIVYILDVYNKYDNNKDVCDVFDINGNKYCIRKVKFEENKLKFDEKPFDDEYTTWEIFASFEEAETMKLKLLGAILD